MFGSCIVIGGNGPEPVILKDIASLSNRVIAADSGYDKSIEAGIQPHILMGDMDSISAQTICPSTLQFRYDNHKDFSDAELALRYACEHSWIPTALCGGGGGRSDHFLANYSLYWESHAPAYWHCGDSELVAVSGGFAMETTKDEEFSIFPVGKGPWVIRSRGLLWPLEPVKWNTGRISLSNRCTGNSMTLEAVSGKFVLVKASSGGAELFTRLFRNARFKP